jgi:hypothetical protein
MPGGRCQPARGWFVLVAGWPGSGKSTLAAVLAAELGLLLARDEIKEALMQGPGRPGTVAASERLGRREAQIRPVRGCLLPGCYIGLYLTKIGADVKGSRVPDVLPWKARSKAAVVVRVLLPDSLVSYGQPARGAGASVVSTRPDRGPVNMFSGPLHSCASMNRVVPLVPPSAREAAAVQADRLEHLPALADAHAALIGDVGVPDGVLGVGAEAVRDAIAQIGPHAPVRQAAVGVDVERGEPLGVGLG